MGGAVFRRKINLESIRSAYRRSLDGHIPSLFGPVVTCGDTRRNNPPDYLLEDFKVGRWFCLRGRLDFDHSLGMETQPLKKVGERERSIRPVFH